MTAGHLIKNYFELFCSKIGINDIIVEFETYFGLIRFNSYCGFIFKWLLWAVVRDHKSNILTYFSAFNSPGIFQIILASATKGRPNKGR